MNVGFVGRNVRNFIEKSEHHPLLPILTFGTPLILSQIMAARYDIGVDIFPLIICGLFLIGGAILVNQEFRIMKHMASLFLFLGSGLTTWCSFLLSSNWGASAIGPVITASFGLTLILLGTYLLKFLLNDTSIPNSDKLKNNKFKLKKILRGLIPFFIISILSIIFNSITIDFILISLYGLLYAIIAHVLTINSNKSSKEVSLPENMQQISLKYRFRIRINQFLLFLLFLFVGFQYQDSRTLGIIGLFSCIGLILARSILKQNIMLSVSYIAAFATNIISYLILCFYPMARYFHGLDFLLGLSVGLLMYQNEQMTHKFEDIDDHCKFKCRGSMKHWFESWKVILIILGIYVVITNLHCEFIFYGLPGVRSQYFYESDITLAFTIGMLLALISTLVLFVYQIFRAKQNGRNYENHNPIKEQSDEKQKIIADKYENIQESQKSQRSQKSNKSNKNRKSRLQNVEPTIIKAYAVLLIIVNFGILMNLNFGFYPTTTLSNPLVYYGSNGELQYSYYANQGEDACINKLPDFSFAGYMGGGQKIPDVDVAITLNAIDGDNSKQIQDAINTLAMTPLIDGFRGAILLKAGLYCVSNLIKLNASGIVLRGEGYDEKQGTRIYTNITYQHSLISVEGTGSYLPEENGTQREINSDYIPTGTNTIPLNSTLGYSVGDEIVVVRTPNQNWIDTLDMAQYGWTTESYAIKHERTITSIQDNNISIDIPVVDSIQAQYGGGYVAKSNVSGRIKQCGIENMRIMSSYIDPEDENHGWEAIVFSRVCNSWVCDVVAEYFGNCCVELTNESNFNTVQDCAMLNPVSITTGGRKYSFKLSDGLGNLIQRCYARGGRHDFVVQARVTGPNVFLDCLSDYPQSDNGPHHRWSTGSLYDSVMGGSLNVRNRKSSGTGHGWVAAQTLLWNCVSFNHNIVLSNAPGSRNWAIGCQNRKSEGNGYWESWRRDVQPRSIYLAQLEERLGSDAINNITSIDQRIGTIYSSIRNKFL